jgi:hypothetical protein
MASFLTLERPYLARNCMPRTAFITYAHDSLTHEERVLALANNLRAAGVDVQIDQYEPHPNEGWAKWMEGKFTKSDAILIAPSEKYLERYAQETGAGTGARFEGAILTSMLLKNGVSFEKFAVVLFDPDGARFIPDLMHACPRYNVSRPNEYDRLYGWLTNQNRVVPPPLGAVVELSPLNLSADKKFSLLCRDIKPLLDENARIFRDFGPNSGADAEGPVRWDLTAWHQLRVSKIAPNNVRIRDLIKTHPDAVPAEKRNLFDSLLSHIDAFEAHISDSKIDYRDHQFPKEIVAIINQTAE